jgi:hypothetical protein
MKILRHGLVVAVIVLLTAQAFASWPASADTNFAVCRRTGQQDVAKVAVTSDGGCYVSWYDWASGNWDIYLQRLDSSGTPQWQTNGILIDGHTQESWVTDYDLAVDREDHAILSMNDIRSGGDRDIYAYRISPAGAFVWGADGIALSNNSDFEPGPRIAVTSGGNIVFAWQQETTTNGNVINLRKLTPAGADVWSPATQTLTSRYGLSIPRVIAADSDQVILQYLIARGTGMYAPKHIYVQKFDSIGTRMWSDTGRVVSANGGIGLQMWPDLIPDGFGGAYSFWYDSHLQNQLHVFAQHVLPNGAMSWVMGGLQLSTSTTEIQSAPSAALVPGTPHVAVFYQTANSGQTQYGFGGQMVTDMGQRRWGNSGIAFAPLGNQSRDFVEVQSQRDGLTVGYRESVGASATNYLLKAMHIDSNGAMIWQNSPRTFCSNTANKGDLVAAVNRFGQFLAVWNDMRSDDGDVYLQNINPNGSLGNLIPPEEPPALLITAPADSSEADALPVMVSIMVQNFVVAASGGDGVVSVQVNGVQTAWHDTPAAVAVTALQPGMNRIVLELVTYGHQPLDPPVIDSLHIRYTPNGTGLTEPLRPAQFALLPAFPNPFNPTTTLGYALPLAAPVQLRIYNSLGQCMATLVDGLQPAGVHRIQWNGAGLAAGIYFCRMETPQFSRMQKIVLIK